MTRRYDPPIIEYEAFIAADWAYSDERGKSEATGRGTTVSSCVATQVDSPVFSSITEEAVSDQEWQGNISLSSVGTALFKLSYVFTNGDAWPCYFRVRARDPQVN